ncbi:hypothetical protein ACWDE9_17815 [Streptomyces olivaceoviridis]
MATERDMVVRLAHDLGGLPAGPVVQSDHEMTPFDRSCHALLNVLAEHKLVRNPPHPVRPRYVRLRGCSCAWSVC